MVSLLKFENSHSPCVHVCVWSELHTANAMYTSSRNSIYLYSAVSDGFVRNFRIASNDGTHIRFSWDIQSGYQSTSYISTFYIYYIVANPGSGSSGYTSYVSFSPSSTTQTNGGLTFSYSTTVSSFSNYAQYIMWLYVYRSTSPTELYSEQIYVEIGETEYRWWCSYNTVLTYQFNLFKLI